MLKALSSGGKCERVGGRASEGNEEEKQALSAEEEDGDGDNFLLLPLPPAFAT